MSNRIVTPGPTEGTVRSTDGKVLTPPEGWELLPPGDAALTRRVKAACTHWIIQEKKGRKIFSKGVWAPEKNSGCDATNPYRSSVGMPRSFIISAAIRFLALTRSVRSLICSRLPEFRIGVVVAQTNFASPACSLNVSISRSRPSRYCSSVYPQPCRPLLKWMLDQSHLRPMAPIHGMGHAVSFDGLQRVVVRHVHVGFRGCWRSVCAASPDMVSNVTSTQRAGSNR